MSARASETALSNPALRQRPESGFMGDESGDVFIPLRGGYRLRSGDLLEDARLQLRFHGNRCGPSVVVLGGISAGRCAGGPQGWWCSSVRSGGAIDLDRFNVIGIDFAPLNNQRVALTAHDQADLIRLALDELGIARLHAFVGASYGGMVALAFGAIAPNRVERLCVIAAAHRPSAQGRAWRGVQRRIIEFGLQQGDAAQGLALARQLAMITYRTPEEFEQRFAADTCEGLGEVDRYLTRRGSAYIDVMAPLRWLSLSEAIDRFSVDPASVLVPTTTLAFTTDRLVPLHDMRDLKSRLPHLKAFHEMQSLYGHDAFLKETAALHPILSAFLKD